MTTLSEPLTLLQAAEVAGWYETFAPMLHRYLLRRMPHMSAQTREELIQDVFVRVVEHTPRMATLDEAHRQNSVFRILKNLLIAYQRHSHEWHEVHAPMLFGELDESHPNRWTERATPVTASRDWLAHMQPEETTMTRLSLQAAWEQVPHMYRELLRLIFAGHDRASIARALGVTEHAVDMRICRMRGLLVELGGKVA